MGREIAAVALCELEKTERGQTSVESQLPGAWADADARYRPGQEVHGLVTRVAHFGMFVQVEPGVEGIVYAFELGPGAPAGFLPGQQVQLYVKDVDARKRRLELSPQPQLPPGLLREQEIPADVRRTPSAPVPGEPASGTQPCPTCLRPVQPTWKYCVYCAGALQRRCPACGTTQPDLAGARYCCECGTQLWPEGGRL